MTPEQEKRLQQIRDRASRYIPGETSRPTLWSLICYDIPWLIQRLREAEAEAAELDADWEYARERCTERCGGPRPTGGR